MKDVLTRIGDLHNQLQELKPLKKEDDERLWKKFRLEWSYNSNHIEGNTLTYGQTELLLMFDKTTGDHELREYEEMKAHDAVVQLVRKYAVEKERKLSEADIREWNKIVLVRPYWKEAITSDGQATRKLVEPGQYKKTHNSVRLSNGELFHYASPEETPVLMDELIQWYRNEEIRSELHPLQLAALLHYKFVRIHPFDDSNGRTARLIMNYVLLKHDYPPVIIKTDDKKNYLFALNKADAGDVEAFVTYIADQLIWSLDISIRAAKGESVSEQGDIYKKIDLWKRDVKKDEIPHQLLIKSIQELYDVSLRKLFVTFLTRVQVFNDVFRRTRFHVKFAAIATSPRESSIISLLDREFLKRVSYLQRNGTPPNEKIQVKVNFEGLKSGINDTTSIDSILKVSIDQDHYTIVFDRKELGKWDITYRISDAEINILVDQCIEITFSKI